MVWHNKCSSYRRSELSNYFNERVLVKNSWGYWKFELLGFHCMFIPFSGWKIINWFKTLTATIQIHHSHKKWKDSLETRTALIEISMLCCNLPSGPKHREWLQKRTRLSMKGISYLQVTFMLIWIKQMLVWLNSSKDGTRNSLSNIKDAFAATNVSSEPKYVHLQGWSLRFIWWLGKI